MATKIELRTLAAKKWLLSLYGQKPTIDINYTGVGKGCHVGDIVLDTTQEPNWIWMCIKQTRNASDFILIVPQFSKTENIIEDYTVNLDIDKIIPVDASNNDVNIYLPVGTKIDGKDSIELNVLNESVTLYTSYKGGIEINIKRLDDSDNDINIIADGSRTSDNWMVI
jgi:hypothetical protein